MTAGFTETKVKKGRYGSASDVVGAGPGLLEEQEARLPALRAALADGEDSGVSDRNATGIWAAVKSRKLRRHDNRGWPAANDRRCPDR